MFQEAVVEKVENLEKLEERCVHHWVIETAGGPTSKGVCQRCGAEKHFYNYIENSPWGDEDKPALRDSARAAIHAVVPTNVEEDDA